MKRNLYFFFKRAFDIVASLMGIIITSPVWVIAIIGIFISDPGPIFYKACRIGKDNREFSMWKFRSMRVPKKESEKSEASFKADTDRIFPFGALCRKLKIDELPQLINILNNTMSVVGPRPAAKDQVAVVRAGKYNIASTVKPGLTGPAALYDYIYGDSVEDPDDYERLVLPTRLELEAYYPAKMSAFYDIKMIWYTVVCILCSVVGKEPKGIFNELVSAVPESKKPEEVNV
ncbi:MAG: sugar transferase [Clostridia bacterium]|nr:sugar transferase [Clostridia bacterium]